MFSVSEIWRYPVKSMQGERLNETPITEWGLPGDRAWAVRDEVRGGIRGAKKIPELMRCRARYTADPKPGEILAAEMTFADGTQCGTDSPDANNALSTALGRRVTLWPLQPASDLDHYRRGAPDKEDLEQELREIFAVLPDETLPDISSLPPEVFEFESPPGTYFDAFPLLVMTDASLRRLSELLPDSNIDVRRFRPNLLIATSPDRAGFVESDWVGKRFRLGDCEIDIAALCPRCVMTTLPFDSLPKDPRIMRTLVREANHNLGVYARVAKAGAVRVGDRFEEIGGV